MASSSKRSRTACEAASVRKQGKENTIQWKDICPPALCQWLEIFSKANNTTMEILLASILPTVACLLGPSNLKVNCRLQAESVNLFMVCLCDPGAGKSPAFHLGCAQPIRLHVESKQDISLFIDEFTEAGLFRQLKSVPGHKAIIGKEEVSQFFEHLLAASREKSKIDMERLIQLYDSSSWVYTRGDKSARQVVDYPGVSLSGYSQPNRFFPLYVKLKDRQDGAVDRMLIYQPMPHRLAAREIREFITKLNQSPVKDLRAVYLRIYEFSNSENGPVTYTLNAEANTRYEAFIDGIAESLNSQWRNNVCTDHVSKDDRHVLRLAVVLHVIYDQLAKLLRREAEPSPPSGEISVATLEQSIALCSYFTEQRRILDQLVCSDIPSTTNDYDKQRRILMTKGPFVSARLAQKSFSGNNRPASSLLVAIMENLQTDGFGKVKKIGLSQVFFKKLPSDVTDEEFQRYEVTREMYLQAFNERADKAVISKEAFNRFLENSPDKRNLDELHGIVPETD